MVEVSGVAVVFGGAFCLTRGFRGWRRGMGGVVAALRRVRFFVSQFLGEGGQSVCFVFLWVPASAKGVNGVLCFSLGSRLRGNDEGVRGRGDLRCHPHPSPLPSRERGCCCRRVKSPGRYLTRYSCVNDLGFAPPP